MFYAKEVVTARSLSKGNFWLFAVGLCLVTSLYVLPTVMPAYIGTGYITVSFCMTAVSIIVWHKEITSPQCIFILSILLCLCLAPLSPYTSNDVQRYMWDGAMFLSGFDPYVIAPDNPRVSHLREIWPTPEEHAQYPTLYPPGALSLFAICAMAGPVYSLWVWKGMVTLALIASLILTYKLLEQRNALKHFVLLAFSPLLLLETQVGGHLDIFSALGVIAALFCIQKDKIVIAGIIIGIAATTKFLPAVLVGPFLFYLNPRKALKLFLSSAMTWLTIYLMMFGLGYKPLGLLPTFFEKWRGGAPFYPYLDALKDWVGLTGSQFLFLITGLALCGFGLSAKLARKGHIEFALILTLACPLLLSPVLFPWYMLALVPFLALKPNLTLFTAMTLAPLSYIVLNKWLSQGIWEQPNWPSHILLLGLILAFAFDIIWKIKATKA